MFKIYIEVIVLFHIQPVCSGELDTVLRYIYALRLPTAVLQKGDKITCRASDIKRGLFLSNLSFCSEVSCVVSLWLSRLVYHTHLGKPG